MKTRIERYTDYDGERHIFIKSDSLKIGIFNVNALNVSINLDNFLGGGDAHVGMLIVPNNRQAKRDAIYRLIKALEILGGVE